MAVRQPALITADEFEAFLAQPENQDRNFELIDGVIVEKAMPTEEHSIVVGLLSYFLAGYALSHGLGIPGPERRIRLPEHLRNTRQPDLAMSLDANRPLVKVGASPVMADVIAEVKSPTDKLGELREKARFYIANGAKLVWVLYPATKRIEVYRPEMPVLTLNADDALDGYDVLPGFSVAVRQLFPETHGG
jgi:Uma2 family endonuclease